MVLVVAAAGAWPNTVVAGELRSRLRPIIIVPAAGTPGPSTAEPGASVSVVAAATAWRGSRGLAELLGHITGVHLRRMGGREDSASLVVRGAGAGRVKVMIDGVSLSRADQTTVNLADIPVDNIERIEVYKGFMPSAFAAAGAESAVNIITRTGDHGPRVSITTGSFGTQRIYAAGTGRLAGGRLQAGLGLRTTDGDFRYTDDNGTEAFTGDDSRRRRDNNDRSSLDLTATWQAERRDGSKLTLRENLFHKDEGLPGLGSNESARARVRMTRNIASLAWESPGGRRRTELGMTLRRERLSDPKSAGDGSAGIGLPFDLEVDTAVAADASTHWRRTVGTAQLVELGLAAAFERFQSRYPGASGGGGAQQRLRGSLVLSDEVALPARGLDLVAQLRHETLWNRFDGQALLPSVAGSDVPSARNSSTDLRLGLSWQAAAPVTVRAGVATYFRPPAFSELFGNDGFSVANPELAPETGNTRDIGLVAELDPGWPRWPALSNLLGPARLEWAYFDNDADDMILFVQTGARVAKPLNVGRARSRGHEFDLSLGMGRAAGLTLAYTVQTATNLSPYPDYHNKELPGRPAQELHATFTYGRPGWNAAWTLTHRTAFYLDQANNPVRRVPAHSIHGLRLGLASPAKGTRLDLELDNLGNEQYADEYGFPVPGRAIYMTISVDSPARP